MWDIEFFPWRVALFLNRHLLLFAYTLLPLLTSQPDSLGLPQLLWGALSLLTDSLPKSE